MLLPATSAAATASTASSVVIPPPPPDRDQRDRVGGVVVGDGDVGVGASGERGRYRVDGVLDGDPTATTGRGQRDRVGGVVVGDRDVGVGARGERRRHRVDGGFGGDPTARVRRERDRVGGVVVGDGDAGACDQCGGDGVDDGFVAEGGAVDLPRAPGRARAGDRQRVRLDRTAAVLVTAQGH